MTGTRLTIRTPADYALARDVCSYGYFILAPNHWDPETNSLFRVLDLDHGATTCRISQNTSALRATFDRPLSRPEQARARAQITRMLNLGMTETDTRAFHKADTRWKNSGRCRLFRSPTLFEDVIKTVTSCNVAWPSTVNMNTRLCDVLGNTSPTKGRAFPSPAKLARTRPATLRSRCRVGYRDQRLVDLAKLFHKNQIDTALIENPKAPHDDVFTYLQTLPGIGPYAAANIMQLAGRYSHLALDTESVRHGKAVLGLTGTDRDILKRVRAHFEPFGDHKFLSYWFELWAFYESKAGPAETWQRESTAKAFTAALLKN